MLGSIIGDICGSVYEQKPISNYATPTLFAPGCRYTDDTVLTCAIADALLTNTPFKDKLLEWGRQYPRAGYGKLFSEWLSSSNPQPYGSNGNGAAMRVAPIGWWGTSLPEVFLTAVSSSMLTHSQRDAYTGAQAIATAVYLTRTGTNKADLKAYLTKTCGYNLNLTCDELRDTLWKDSTALTTVPAAITAYLESNNFEHCIRLAISLGGDTDTIACMAGGIAEAAYGVPEEMVEPAFSTLDDRMLYIIEMFNKKFKHQKNGGRKK